MPDKFLIYGESQNGIPTNDLSHEGELKCTPQSRLHFYCNGATFAVTILFPDISS